MRSFLTIALVISAVFSACRKDHVETVAPERSQVYFNDKIGAAAIFEVEEIFFDDFNNSADTAHYQLKEFNESEFSDNLGQRAIRIERYKRISDTSKWEFLNTVYAVMNRYSTERVENNQRIVVQSYPISNEIFWNLNVENNIGEWLVYYNDFDFRFSINANTYDNCLRIMSDPIISSFRERTYEEVYAKNVGLIYRKQARIEKKSGQMKGDKITCRILRYEF
jgi:hypothetical protein